jgi:hypothetical protein
MQCQLLILQAVGKLCYGGKAMNESSASSFYMVLLFVLRCIVPLAILFGISYLLRRMGLVAIEAPEPKEEPAPKEEPVEKPTKDSGKVASSPKPKNATQSKNPKKRKAFPPRKKTAKKTKTGTSRSSSK